MKGFRFTGYQPPEKKEKSDFERLLKIFMELMLITSGNVSEALKWLTDVDRQYKLTTPEYGIGDFIEDLKKKGYLSEEEPGQYQMTAKSEQKVRHSALEEIFGKLRRVSPAIIKLLFLAVVMNKVRIPGLLSLVMPQNRFP